MTTFFNLVNFAFKSVKLNKNGLLIVLALIILYMCYAKNRKKVKFINFYYLHLYVFVLGYNILSIL